MCIRRMIKNNIVCGTIIIIVLIPTLLCAQVINEDQVGYHVGVYKDISEYLNDLFQRFSDGYVQPEKALEKVNLLKHEYTKLSQSVPPEAERLFDLLKQLLYHVENYFIHFKRVNMENPEINMEIAKINYALSAEAERLEGYYN